MVADVRGKPSGGLGARRGNARPEATSLELIDGPEAEIGLADMTYDSRGLLIR